MDKLRYITRITQHPAGRSGLLIGFLIGFITVLMNGLGKTLFYASLFVCWQYIWHFCVLFFRHER
ncbi:MAG TPA: hypothetical protein VJ761_06700 [Ktedonobacteraceae bacterium]|nr:hypothetical protein [Ktedonobacteraceae bacterium]